MANYSESENWNRNVRTIAEHSKKFPMTRKVDKTEYEDLATCIRSDQVPAEEIAEILGCPLGTVRSRIFRGRELLQQTISEQIDINKKSRNYE